MDINAIKAAASACKSEGKGLTSDILTGCADEIQKLRTALYDADRDCRYTHLYDEDAEIMNFNSK